MKAYRKLADLRIIHAQHLSLLTGAETEARNEVEQEQDNARSTERIDESGHRIRQLIGQLDPMTVEPAALYD